MFNDISKKLETIFIEYYFKDYHKSNFLTRLFGREIISGSPDVLRLGNIRLLLYLLKNKPKVIHILTAERFTIPVYLYKTILKSKIVTTLHSVLRYEIPNDPLRRRKFGKYKDYFWERFAIKFSNILIFLSNPQLELAKKFYNFNNNKTTIIPHGVESEFYNANKILDTNESIKIVFYNGLNDSIERGLDSIIKVLNKLNNKKIKLYIIGKRKKISNAEFYYELVSPMDKNELINFLKDKHILLKSEIVDSFSIFGIECMAAGLIAIVSKNVGICSFIKNGENGFVYDNLCMDQLETILINIFKEKI